jgi:hypothetical protein
VAFAVAKRKELDAISKVSEQHIGRVSGPHPATSPVPVSEESSPPARWPLQRAADAQGDVDGFAHRATSPVVNETSPFGCIRRRPLALGMRRSGSIPAGSKRRDRISTQSSTSPFAAQLAHQVFWMLVWWPLWVDCFWWNWIDTAPRTIRVWTLSEPSSLVKVT